MKKSAIVFALSLLTILSAAYAVAPVSSEGDEQNLFCQLAASAAPSADGVNVVQAPELTLFAGQACGICSYSDCLGAMEGAICTRRFGGQGVCAISGKICGDHSKHCGCF